MQDPTGTAKASVHKKVLQHPECRRDIEVRCVLILKNVMFYLNLLITNGVICASIE